MRLWSHIFLLIIKIAIILNSNEIHFIVDRRIKIKIIKKYFDRLF